MWGKGDVSNFGRAGDDTPNYEETAMSMVERLAEKYESEVLRLFRWQTLGHPNHIRWWLNAIADELNDHLQTQHAMNDYEVIEWLRAQANGESDV